jgi:hypothetical protein
MVWSTGFSRVLNFRPHRSRRTSSALYMQFLRLSLSPFTALNPIRSFPKMTVDSNPVNTYDLAQEDFHGNFI